MRRYPGWTAKDNYVGPHDSVCLCVSLMEGFSFFFSIQGKRKRRQQNQQRSGTCSGSDQFSLQDSFQ